MPKRYLIAVLAALPVTVSAVTLSYTSPTHVFSEDDITAAFDGTLATDDASVICDTEAPCPGEAQPMTDKSGTMLYPVDSEFGYYVSDFVGAAQKTLDGDYGEGFVGNHTDGDGTGLMVSNAATDTFRAGANRGTWCSGMGGTSVKCSSEHYVVMEHVLTCHETVPYAYADPVTGTQGDLLDPETGNVIGSCGDPEALLDDQLEILVGNAPGSTLTSMGQLAPNESTIREDIALGDDYSITKKDDGKPLYRWGDMVKRPNDIRIYAKLDLPADWKATDLGGNYINDFDVLSAKLHVKHWITNNPNDQLRPEDMENEAASGILPEYTEASGNRYSSKDCYEGDGDYIPAGTVLLNSSYTDGGAFSADLQEGLTNAWYTSLDRDPFDGTLDSPTESGPRWRLKANKFGQDIPGLEIPTAECSQPPFIGGTERYEVGTVVTTVIDLLDWEQGQTSPLATSLGWVDHTANTVNEESATYSGISINGLPLTEDFDLGVYIKGDRKSTVIYEAWLEIDYDDGV